MTLDGSRRRGREEERDEVDRTRSTSIDSKGIERHVKVYDKKYDTNVVGTRTEFDGPELRLDEEDGPSTRDPSIPWGGSESEVDSLPLLLRR